MKERIVLKGGTFDCWIIDVNPGAKSVLMPIVPDFHDASSYRQTRGGEWLPRFGMAEYHRTAEREDEYAVFTVKA